MGGQKVNQFKYMVDIIFGRAYNGTIESSEP